MGPREATIKRKTDETKIEISLNIEGTGKTGINTGIPFLNHMLNLFARHGLFDLTIVAKGDLEVDEHHTVEDVGISLGQAFRQALGDKTGIHRYGDSIMPMDESLVMVAVDISGRPHLIYDMQLPARKTGQFDTSLIVEFLHAFVNHAAITLHLKMLSGRNTHHIIEGAFKGIAVALREACATDPRVIGVPSTKGEL
ncbi:MAG: imidazoleglycerol-phosphate dehydratase HisB [Actinobacteria bacterium]|nr:imidazoleglycerol-phosphate dehydratase HisB [Actinomycetota bacterium]